MYYRFTLKELALSLEGNFTYHLSKGLDNDQKSKKAPPLGTIDKVDKERLEQFRKLASGTGYTIKA